MGKSFSISESKRKLRVRPGQTESITFTVTNKTGQDMAVHTEARFVDAGDNAWLSLDVEEVKNFAANDTRQYRVKIAVPPTAENGKYAFTLRVYSVEDPDEYFAESSAIEVNIVPRDRRKKKRSFMKAMLIAFVLIVVVAGILWGGTTITTLKRQLQSERQERREAERLLEYERQQGGRSNREIAQQLDNEIQKRVRAEEQLKQIQQQHTTLQSELSRLQQNYATLQDESGQLQQRISGLQQEVQQQEQQRINVEREFQALKSGIRREFDNKLITALQSGMIDDYPQSKLLTIWELVQ
jgi:hypothetical protein